MLNQLSQPVDGEMRVAYNASSGLLRIETLSSLFTGHCSKPSSEGSLNAMIREYWLSSCVFFACVIVCIPLCYHGFLEMESRFFSAVQCNLRVIKKTIIYWKAGIS